MNNIFKILRNTVLTMAFCSNLFSCGIPIETSKGTLVIDDRDSLLRNHKDPSLMTHEIDQDMNEETMRNIEKQSKKEETARQKRLNEIIEKQLQPQEGKSR